MTHFNLGNVFRRKGDLQAAAASYRQAVSLRPNDVQAHTNLGATLHELNRFDEAVHHYQQAIRINPRLVQAHNNLGSTLRKLGRLDEAAVCYQAALRLLPDSAAIHKNLGGVFADQQELEKAVACFQEAVRLDPNLAEAHAGLGIALHDLGSHEEGLAHLAQALTIQPTDRLRIAWATRLPGIYQSMSDLMSSRNRLIQEVRLLREHQIVLDLTEETAVNVFYLAYHGMNDRDIQRDIAGLYRAPPQDLARPQASGKIRVGFLSSFFRKHTIGHLMKGLVARLSRADFEVIVLSVGNHAGEIADSFRRHADRFVVVPKHLPSARKAIAQQQLDVLFYTDIGMDPFTGTLAYSRLAPVQCVTWGHPSTTGISTIDYFISSEDLETDGADQHYTETLVRLKALPICYEKPRLPDPPQGREHFGLALDDHVYACPQTLFKFHPEFDEFLGGILRGDPRGIVVLIKSKHPQGEQMLRRRFTATLPDVADRIRFLPAMDRPDFLNLLAVSDVLLDPLHFGGGNTTYEALAVNTPVVTLPSQFLRGRITYALYKQMKMLDCVVENRQDYVKLALRLGTDAEFRQAMRAKIAALNDLLYENSGGVKDLEGFFKGICYSS